MARETTFGTSTFPALHQYRNKAKQLFFSFFFTNIQEQGHKVASLARDICLCIKTVLLVWGFYFFHLSWPLGEASGACSTFATGWPAFWRTLPQWIWGFYFFHLSWPLGEVSGEASGACSTFATGWPAFWLTLPQWIWGFYSFHFSWPLFTHVAGVLILKKKSLSWETTYLHRRSVRGLLHLRHGLVCILTHTSITA